MRGRFLFTTLVALLCASLVTPAHGAAGDVAWAHPFPSQWGCVALGVTPDGAAAITLSEVIVDTGIDVIVTRIDASTGTVDWKYRFNGAFRHHDSAVDLALSPDGSVTGVLAMANAGAYGVLIGLDTETGTVLWTTEIRGRFDTNRRTTSVADLDVTASDGFVVAAATPSRKGRSDALTLSIDAASGAERWRRRVDVAGDSGSVVTSAGAGVYMGVMVVRRGRVHGWFVRIDDATGDLEWLVKHGVEASYDIEVSPDGESLYALSASLWALDATDGAEAWRLPRSEVPAPGGALEVADDGSLYVTGTLGGLATKRLSPVDGGTLWSATYTGPGQRRDEGHAIVLPGDGTVVVVGSRDVQYDPVLESDMLALAYDASTGSPVWTGAYLEPGVAVETGQQAGVVSGGDVVACGRVTSDGFGAGASTVRFATT